MHGHEQQVAQAAGEVLVEHVGEPDVADVELDRGGGEQVPQEQQAVALRGLPQEGPLLLGIRSKTRVTRAVLEAVPQLTAVGALIPLGFWLAYLR